MHPAQEDRRELEKERAYMKQVPQEGDVEQNGQMKFSNRRDYLRRL